MDTVSRADRRIMKEWLDDLDDAGWQGVADRVTTRTLGDLVACRVGGRCEWSRSSEAVYVSVGEVRMRIACHPGGGVGSQAGGYEAPVADVRLGDAHDETSTHLCDTPSDEAEMVETADWLAEIARRGLTAVASE